MVLFCSHCGETAPILYHVHDNRLCSKCYCDTMAGRLIPLVGVMRDANTYWHYGVSTS